MIQFLAIGLLVLFFAATGFAAIVQHGRIVPPRRFNCFPILGLLVVEMTLVAFAVGVL